MSLSESTIQVLKTLVVLAYSHIYRLITYSKRLLLSHISPPNRPNTSVVLEQESNIPIYMSNRATPRGLGLAEEDGYEFNWSTSLIPLPLHYITDSIKKQLPVMDYSSVSGPDDDYDRQCAVCLSPLEATQQVRELCNCCHVFHKDCLDSWIDKSNVTCPLCRADLLPSAAMDQAYLQLNKGRGE